MSAKLHLTPERRRVPAPRGGGQPFPGRAARRTLAPEMAGFFCSSCGREAPADAQFCPACGKPLARPPAADPAPAPGEAAAAAAARVQAPAAGETDVFTLKPLVVRTFFECFVSIVTLGLAWVFLWISRMGRRYLVTTQRIETRTGIATVTREYVDLFRIEDFEIVQPFFLRLRASGNLVIRSMDQDEPILVMEAVPGVQEVYETLRRLVNDERDRRRVSVVEGLQR